MTPIKGGRKYAATRSGAWQASAVTVLALVVCVINPVLAAHVGTITLGYFGCLALMVTGHSGAQALEGRGKTTVHAETTISEPKAPA